MSLPTIQAVGNLVADPELRFTAAGKPVSSFRIACTDRRKNQTTGEWEDGDSLFISCVSWSNAEAITEQLKKGSKVVINGTLRSNSYTAKDGTERTNYEINAHDVALVVREANTYSKQQVTGSDSWTVTPEIDGAPF